MSNPLTLSDFQAAAAAIGCDVAAIRAVDSVESGGAGFLADGRPKILFEAHYFSRLTDHKFDGSNPNVSSRTWNRSLYGAAGAHQHERLDEAAKLNRDAALRSCSWGRYQIMGDNFRACGFTSLQAFINAHFKSEAAHLQAFAAFIISNPAMRKALIERDWETFARLYNGPGYKVNKYHIKLENDFKRWSIS